MFLSGTFLYDVVNVYNVYMGLSGTLLVCVVNLSILFMFLSGTFLFDVVKIRAVMHERSLARFRTESRSTPATGGLC